ncbi:MAG: hypothetical protein KIT22_03015 [Verrucomicrobiae bacterium]|nr:hypothetical protein [Verrucomicrobiae bacterium]
MKKSSESSSTPETKPPTWCRSSVFRHVIGKIPDQVAAVRKWRQEFNAAVASFDAVSPSTATRRADAIIEKLSEVAGGDQFADVASELRVIELARGPFGGRLRAAAMTVVSRRFAEGRDLVHELVESATRQLDLLENEAAERESAAVSAVEANLGEAPKLDTLTRKVTEARARVAGLWTEFQRQFNAHPVEGRSVGFLECLDA